MDATVLRLEPGEALRFSFGASDERIREGALSSRNYY